MIMHPLYNLCAIFSVLISIPYAAPSPLELTKAYTSLLAKSSSGVSGVNATFDYVIVGGGTAGLTIASRLAENSLFSVVVIEAGGFYELDDGNRSVVPGYASFYAGTDPNDTQPLVDWNFVTEPQAVKEPCITVSFPCLLTLCRAQIAGSCIMLGVEL